MKNWILKIDVEDKDNFIIEPPARCKDVFLNTIYGDANDYIPKEEVLEEEGGLRVEYFTHDSFVK